MIDSARTIEGCIFNLDGVIVDTGKYHYQAWRRLANQFGFDFSKEQNEELKGYSRMASLEAILDWGEIYMPEAEKMHWADVKNNWYVNLISNMKPGEVLPGVLAFLRQVRELGKKTALSSASQSARSVLRSTHLDVFFDVILDGNEVKKPKPDPSCFLMAAAALQLPPAACIVFEDSPPGVDAALLGGFTVVGVGKPEYLPKAHIVIEGFEHFSFNALLAQLTERVTS